MVSIGTYCIITTLSTAAVIMYAVNLKQQFYLTVIHLVNNKFSLMSLCNFGVLVTILFGRSLKSLFFGSLRDMEVESLNENTYYAIIETLLALPVFHEELSLNFMAIFGVLLFIKMFHWLAQCRLDFIEQTPNIGFKTHFRIVTLMSLLLTADWVLLYLSAVRVMKQGPSVMMLFVYESIILTSSISSSMLKYAFCVIDRLRDGQWESKGSLVFYLELATDLFQLTVYLIFFGVIAYYFRFPLHLVRDVWKTFEGFRQRIGDFVRYRKATSNMRNRYPDATPEELAATDRTCIICRDEMETAKRLPCGHLFHFVCLRSWLERQQTCPTCRTSVLDAPTTTPPAPAPAAPAPAAAPAPEPAPAAAEQPPRAEPAPAQQPKTPTAPPTTTTSAAAAGGSSKSTPAASSSTAASSKKGATAAAAPNLFASSSGAAASSTPTAQPATASPMATPTGPVAMPPPPTMPTPPQFPPMPPPPGMPGAAGQMPPVLPYTGMPLPPPMMPVPPSFGVPSPSSPFGMQHPLPVSPASFLGGVPPNTPVATGTPTLNASLNASLEGTGTPADELLAIQEHMLAIQQHQHSVMQLMGRQIQRMASLSPSGKADETLASSPTASEKGKGRKLGGGLGASPVPSSPLAKTASSGDSVPDVDEA